MEATEQRILNTTGAKTPKGKDYDYLEIDTITTVLGTDVYKFYYKDGEIIETEY